MKSHHTHLTLRSAVIALLAVILLVGAGCKSDETEKATEAREKSTSEEDTESTDEPAENLAKNREAFGLPLPPQVTAVDRSTERVRVVTTLSLDELADFYESRLQDYEILRPPDKLRVLGLREYMPEISGHRVAGTVRLFYSPNRESPQAKSGDEEGTGATASDNASDGQRAQASGSSTTPLYKRSKGEPVRDRTSDGELLAPGAKWGEPYTPPPGSPLHKERYKSNWGKPYGEWISQ